MDANDDRGAAAVDDAEPVCVWLVERTYPDDVPSSEARRGP
jgi:hypothetical protein